MAAKFESAYTEEALQSAETFRLLMEAMARPGKIVDVPDDMHGVGKMNAGAVTVALTLCDHETPVWIDPKMDAETVIDFLRFQTGCPITERKTDTMFAFFHSVPAGSDLDRFPGGNPSYPDQSATLVIQVEAIHDEGPLTLFGPGIQTNHRLGVTGLDGEFWQWWSRNASRFPLGMDVILTTDDRLAALPRTVKVLEAA